MQVLRAYKTELDPNNVQQTLLAKHAGAARFTWNWALSRRIEEYKLTGKSSNAIEQHRQLNAMKPTDFPWMYEVSKCAPQEALRDLDKAYRNFFAGRAKLPKFKSKRRGLGGFRLTGSITIEADRIKLPRVGWLRLKESGYLPTDAKINSVTVKERAGRWFVSVQVEEQIVVTENQGPAIGLDLGLKSFVVGSDGSSLDAPKPLLRSLRRLQRLSRQHSRKQKGSMNRRKAAKRLAKFHYRIACQRADFIHKATSILTKTKSVIVVEDLNVGGMLKNHCLARSISDAGWSTFVRQLEYKSAWHGSRVIKAGRFFPSTKTCSACGMVKEEISLSERVYRCDGCGLVLDRDVNAAKNLLNLSTGSSPGFQACGDSPLGGSAKQEPSVMNNE
jgi:putative transposase